jgi:TonB family protein
MTYLVLEALHGWRFAPARSSGEPSQPSQPIAAFYNLSVNPPAKRPLAELAPLAGALADVEKRLRSGDFKGAGELADRVWLWTLAQPQEPAPGLLGVSLALRALAAAGGGRTAEAICRWQAAQNLEPRLLHADLAAYGQPGALLAANGWSWPAWRPPGDPRTVAPPRILGRRAPYFPLSARPKATKEAVVLRSVLGADGRVRDLVLTGPSRFASLNASALDTVCDWSFRPATAGGQPTEVFYDLTVNFERPRRGLAPPAAPVDPAYFPPHH